MPETQSLTALAKAVTEPEIDSAIEGLDQDLQPVAKKIAGLLLETALYELERAYEIGSIIRDYLAGLRKNGTRTYGDGVFGKLARALGVNEQSLRTLVKIAETYKKPKFKSLVQKGVKLAHFRELVRIEDSAERQRIEIAIHKQHLTTAEAAKLVRSVVPADRRGSGRAPQLPSTPQKALDWVGERLQRFHGAMIAAVGDADGNVIRQLHELPPAAWSQEMAGSIAGSIKGFRENADLSSAFAEELAEILERGRRIMAAHKEKTEGPENDGADAGNALSEDRASDEEINDVVDEETADEWEVEE